MARPSVVVVTNIRILAGLTALALAIALVGCDTPAGTTGGATSTATSSGAVTEVAVPDSAVRVLARGLRVPWGIAFLPDGTALVTERGNRTPGNAGGTARIVRVTPDGTVTEAQKIPGVANRIGEGGLLGIAVSPHYASDRWVYIYYSNETDNRIARLRLGEPPEPILTGIPVHDYSPDGDRYHLGGRLAFGPDGMLYATTGETAVQADLAQDRNSLGGKILRITPEGRPAPGNPFPGSPVYSLGHRNVQGLAWDSRGRLYASELGDKTFDELNRIEAGRNYGWPMAEGTAGLANDARFTPPIATWSPTSTCSPSGIAILNDRVYVACLAGHRLYRVGIDGQPNEAMLVNRYGRMRAVTVAPDGSLWLLTSNLDGPGVRGEGGAVPHDDFVIRLAP